MVGTIKQKIYVSSIPKGLTFRVTALNLLRPDPPKEWRATLYDNAERERYAPFDVNPSVNGGFVGVVKMYGSHAFPSNSLGARLEIIWELTGVATKRTAGEQALRSLEPTSDEEEHPALKPESDNEPAPTVDPNDPNSWATKLDELAPMVFSAGAQPARSGRFIVETTEWGLIQRPDYVSVLYQIGSATPLRVVSKVAATIIDMPSDALFVIGANTTTQEIGINGVQDKAVADTLTSYAIAGIFWFHEKAFGWIMGKLW